MHCSKTGSSILQTSRQLQCKHRSIVIPASDHCHRVWPWRFMSNEDEQPRVTSHHLTLPTPLRHRSSQYLNLPLPVDCDVIYKRPHTTWYGGIGLGPGDIVSDGVVSDIAVFVLKKDVILQPTNEQRTNEPTVRWAPSLPPHKGAQQSPTFRPTALGRASPNFTHNPYCRLGSAPRAALVAIL